MKKHFCSLLSGLALLLPRVVLAQDVSAGEWPVSHAKAGFGAIESAHIKSDYPPRALGLAGNYALYTYLNMAEFYPHQVVARSGAVQPLPVELDPSIGATRVTTSLGRLSLDEFVRSEQSRLQGIVVLHHGKIIYEQYPGMKPTDTHLWWSASKVIAGLLTEVLIEQGVIDPELGVDHYLTEFKETEWAGVKVEHILHQASGMDALDTTENYGDPSTAIGKLIVAEAILQSPVIGAQSHDQVLAEMKRRGPSGTRFEYSSANTNMLGLLIERVTGERYGDVVQSRIWRHIGAEGDALMGLTPEGRAIAHGMFSSRLRDFARFGLLFTPDGYKADVLPQAVLNRIGDSNRHNYYKNSPQAADRDEKIHGTRPVSAPSQWGALFADGDLFKSGFHGQAIYVSPSRGVVVAMFSTTNNPEGYAYARALALRFPVDS